ncbi:LexA family transcriptional regulator [Sphingomonas cannabina]|uniref:LexA family transcriptional regulator n=1 Tax=Sphingomonas cannabina TaxID=2899123 RepID=UPI001F3F63C2|nr:LexA family transcriptional regulator [Sphingomonas cannabina]UIJ46914.1 LexA family transcriptional regulator [Sphingomonas cannabina]
MWEWTQAAAARLRMLAREWGKQPDLAEKSGIPIATLQRILAGKSDPGQARLKAIVDVIGTTEDHILKGTDPLAESIVNVPVNDIQVSAGPGRFALDEDQAVGRWPFPREWLDQFGDPSLLRLVEVKGDSQEPDLRDGDLTLINLGKSTLTDGMHVVRLDDALMIKRIQIEGGQVRLKSANPSYGDIVIDLAADQERFRVVARAEMAVKRL